MFVEVRSLLSALFDSVSFGWPDLELLISCGVTFVYVTVIDIY